MLTSDDMEDDRDEDDEGEERRQGRRATFTGVAMKVRGTRLPVHYGPH